MKNDYKADKDKPPVLDAVFIPYRRSILAIAAMKADMAVKHKLMGAVNPFMEWAQLPDGKGRLGNAGARHVCDPWSYNTADALAGTPGHLHMVHGIVGLLMALELHLIEQETEYPLTGGLPDLGPLNDPTGCSHGGRLVHHSASLWSCGACGDYVPVPIHGPAGADWREKPARCSSADCVKDHGHRGNHEASNGLQWPRGEDL